MTVSIKYIGVKLIDNQKTKHIQERIKAAAIKRNDGIISTGKSHADIIKSSPYGTCKKGSNQGFVTNLDRFVDRYEAAIIALESKQIKKLQVKNQLLSEDLWFIGEWDYDPRIGYYQRFLMKITYVKNKIKIKPKSKFQE